MGIGTMIQNIQKVTTNVVSSMDKGLNEVEKGKEKASHASESLSSIIASTTKVIEAINFVASANEEQAAVASEVSKSIEEINRVSAESAAGVDQIAETLVDMKKLTENLRVLVSSFKLDEQKSLQKSN